MKKKLPRVVVHTNICVSALLASKTCSAVIDKFIEERFTLVFSELTLKEIEYVFCDEAIGFSLLDAERLKTIITSNIEIIPPTTPIHICRDPKDNMFIETAIAAKADCIVSGDKDIKVLKSVDGIPILSPGAFIKFLEA